MMRHSVPMTNSQGVISKGHGRTFKLCHALLSCSTTNKNILKILASFYKILKDYFTFLVEKLKRTETDTETITGIRDDASQLLYGLSKNQRSGIIYLILSWKYLGVIIEDICF